MGLMLTDAAHLGLAVRGKLASRRLARSPNGEFRRNNVARSSLPYSRSR